MKKGDLVLAHIQFTDFSGTKIRPGLVLAPENSERDVILAFITSQTQKQDQSSVFVSPKEAPASGLKKESIIKLNRITTLNENIILGKIGSLPSEMLEEVDHNLRKLFQL